MITVILCVVCVMGLVIGILFGKMDWLLTVDPFTRKKG